MKKLLLIVSLAALGGCASVPNNAPYYGANAARPADPSQWQVVSVTPVAPGTGERLAAASPNGSSTQFSSTPIRFVPQPVYVPQPLYVPQPYYYSPLSIGLGFGFGRGFGGHRGWGGHGHSRGGVGIGIGTQWHR